jgi:hypothetical protein
MNSSENIFKEKAEEVLEANTYNNGTSTKNQNKKNREEMSEIMKQNLLKSLNTEPKTDAIRMVRIRKLGTR